MATAILTVVYDACVLYPAPLRDLLMRLALTDLFRAKWTADIHEEWIRNVLKDRPDLSREQLEKTRRLMDAHARDCLVTGYEALIPALRLPDPEDRHVLAAAIRAQAQLIITFNLKDFPTRALDPYGIGCQHPDEFVTYLLDVNQARVVEAIRKQRAALKNPPKTVDEFLAILQRQGLAKTVNELRLVSALL
jgi:predicted nucleic acid-binding protein